MDAPAGRTHNAIYVLGRNQRRKNIADPVYEVAPNTSVIIFFEKAPQTAVADTSDDHLGGILYGITVRNQAPTGFSRGKRMPPSCRWQAAQWPGVTWRKAGASLRQRAIA